MNAQLIMVVANTCVLTALAAFNANVAQVMYWIITNEPAQVTDYRLMKKPLNYVTERSDASRRIIVQL